MWKSRECTPESLKQLIHLGPGVIRIQIYWITEFTASTYPNGLRYSLSRACFSFYEIPCETTLPKTNSSHLKIGHPNRKVVFQPSVFRGYVSCKEGNIEWFWDTSHHSHHWWQLHNVGPPSYLSDYGWSSHEPPSRYRKSPKFMTALFQFWKVTLASPEFDTKRYIKKYHHWSNETWNPKWAQDPPPSSHHQIIFHPPSELQKSRSQLSQEVSQFGQCPVDPQSGDTVTSAEKFGSFESMMFRLKPVWWDMSMLVSRKGTGMSMVLANQNS